MKRLRWIMKEKNPARFAFLSWYEFVSRTYATPFTCGLHATRPPHKIERRGRCFKQFSPWSVCTSVRVRACKVFYCLKFKGGGVLPRPPEFWQGWASSPSPRKTLSGAHPADFSDPLLPFLNPSSLYNTRVSGQVFVSRLSKNLLRFFRSIESMVAGSRTGG